MAYGLTQSADLESSSSQYASRADNALLQPTTALTLEGWFKFESLPSAGTLYRLFSKNSGTGNQRSYIFYLENNGGTYQLSYVLSSNGSSADANFVTWSPSTGTWYHLAMTFAGTGTLQVKFYVDGVQQGATKTTTVGSLFDNTTAFSIGGEALGDFFDGRISLARMWLSTRTVGEISGSMCSVLGATTNLSGEWTLDNTLNDNSGNALTLTNNATFTFGVDTPATCAAGGLTTVKTWDGRALASIKTFDGNTAANTKTVIGNA